MALIAARLIQFVAALIVFGAPLFFLYGFVPGTPRGVWPRALVAGAALGAIVGLLWWLAVKAAALVPGATAFDPAAIAIIVQDTQFGRVCLVRLGLLVLFALALLMPESRTRWAVLSVLGAVILASFAWTGHGIADSGVAGLVHTSADVLHLLAAGLWIGVLVALVFVLRRAGPDDGLIAAHALERFSGIGPAVVAVLVLTGLVNTWFLVGPAHWRALFVTAYGLGVGAKIALLAAMLVFAVSNRYRLGPALRRSLEKKRSTRADLARLRASVLSETALAVLVLVAVSIIGTLAPPIDL